MTCNKIKNYIGYIRNKYEISPLKKSKFVKQIKSFRVHENHDMGIEKTNINYRYTLFKLQADTTARNRIPTTKDRKQNAVTLRPCLDFGFGEGKGNGNGFTKPLIQTQPKKNKLQI